MTLESGSLLATTNEYTAALTRENPITCIATPRHIHTNKPHSLLRFAQPTPLYSFLFVPFTHALLRLELAEVFPDPRPPASAMDSAVGAGRCTAKMMAPRLTALSRTARENTGIR